MLVFWFRWFTRRTEPNVGLIVGFAAGLWRPHGEARQTPLPQSYGWRGASGRSAAVRSGASVSSFQIYTQQQPHALKCGHATPQRAERRIDELRYGCLGAGQDESGHGTEAISVA